jgi:hypothetical protein
MHYQTLIVRKRKPTAKGAFSEYFQLSKRLGVKVYRDRKGTKADLDFTLVKRDFDLLKRIACLIRY